MEGEACILFRAYVNFFAQFTRIIFYNEIHYCSHLAFVEPSELIIHFKRTSYSSIDKFQPYSYAHSLKLLMQLTSLQLGRLKFDRLTPNCNSRAEFLLWPMRATYATAIDRLKSFFFLFLVSSASFFSAEQSTRAT
jgi:hypothetical protein